MSEGKDQKKISLDVDTAVKWPTNQRFIIPDVCNIDLQTGEVELYIDDVSEAARQFWEAVMRIAGGDK